MIYHDSATWGIRVRMLVCCVNNEQMEHFMAVCSDFSLL